MKKYILLLTLVAMISGCDNESEPQHPLIGEWKQTYYGKIIDGNIEMQTYSGVCNVTFFINGNGWEYYSDDRQHSFKWSLSDDQLITTDWNLETDILIDYAYHRGNDWTVLQLSSDELTVSCRMSVAFPDSGLQPFDAVMTFERVK